MCGEANLSEGPTNFDNEGYTVDFEPWDTFYGVKGHAPIHDNLYFK